jgi:hypothetical protein
MNYEERIKIATRYLNRFFPQGYGVKWIGEDAEVKSLARLLGSKKLSKPQPPNHQEQ